jgi:ribosome biogenesis GTPase
MKLEELGYNIHLETYRTEQHLESFETGRVIAEHKERYIIKTVNGDFEAEITGNMRFTAKSREDFPAVGDWVALTVFEGDFAIIHHIFPRFSVLKRQAIGQLGEVQLIAVNIDYAFLVQAADRDFNINRLERYLTLCHSAKVKPIILLTKIDLSEETALTERMDQIKARVEEVPLIAISNLTRTGYDQMDAHIEPGKTYCMLGSSGVGKSSLVNNLAGKSIMQTGSISQSTSKGKHITSHRELHILENGGIFIDNPGMREVGIADTSTGLETTFEKIVSLSQNCKYKDCTHSNETGCNVLEALEQGELDLKSYKNYLKLEREKKHFETSVAERRKKDKEFGNMLKNFKKDLRKE